MGPQIVGGRGAEERVGGVEGGDGAPEGHEGGEPTDRRVDRGPGSAWGKQRIFCGGGGALL